MSTESLEASLCLGVYAMTKSQSTQALQYSLLIVPKHSYLSAANLPIATPRDANQRIGGLRGVSITRFSLERSGRDGTWSLNHTVLDTISQDCDHAGMSTVAYLFMSYTSVNLEQIKTFIVIATMTANELVKGHQSSIYDENQNHVWTLICLRTLELQNVISTEHISSKIGPPSDWHSGKIAWSDLEGVARQQHAIWQIYKEYGRSTRNPACIGLKWQIEEARAALHARFGPINPLPYARREEKEPVIFDFFEGRQFWLYEILGPHFAEFTDRKSAVVRYLALWKARARDDQDPWGARWKDFVAAGKDLDRFVYARETVLGLSAWNNLRRELKPKKVVDDGERRQRDGMSMVGWGLRWR